MPGPPSAQKGLKTPFWRAFGCHTICFKGSFEIERLNGQIMLIWIFNLAKYLHQLGSERGLKLAGGKQNECC